MAGPNEKVEKVIVVRAEEIMNCFVVTMKVSDSVKKAAELMRDERVGIVCICTDSGVPSGVITDRDIAVRACAEGLPVAETSVEMVMTPSPFTCGLDAAMDDVERAMAANGVGRVLVLNGEKNLAGIITLAEIWHSESPFVAGTMSRRITEREMRVERTGGHFDMGRARHQEQNSE